jgi:hypothetical protein
MSDVIDRLARFTPADRLDRDEMLFRAGRASAPSRRPWVVLAAFLAATQVATLIVWSTRPQNVVIVESSVPIVQSVDPEPPPYTPLTIHSVWADPALR